MDPGFKAVGGLVGGKNKSAFDGKPFGAEDDDELEHERGVLAMVSDAKGNQGSEFYFFLGEGSTVCAAQLDTKHQVIGTLVGGTITLKKIEQLMHDNFHASRNEDKQRSLGGRPVGRKAAASSADNDDADVVVISACGQCEWGADDELLEAEAVAEAESREERRAKAAKARRRSFKGGSRGPRDNKAMSVAVPARNRCAREKAAQSVA